MEFQPMYWKYLGTKRITRRPLLFYLVTSTLTVRTEYIYDHQMSDNRFLLQLYYYSPI